MEQHRRHSQKKSKNRNFQNLLEKVLNFTLLETFIASAWRSCGHLYLYSFLLTGTSAPSSRQHFSLIAILSLNNASCDGHCVTASPPLLLLSDHLDTSAPSNHSENYISNVALLPTYKFYVFLMGGYFGSVFPPIAPICDYLFSNYL